uniref:b(0,+)-type amino acid transporter 1 n=1 Tax=Astyanax mexicanus TaxID=7994 RepID=A0A8B9JNC6_ASTMX
MKKQEYEKLNLKREVGLIGAVSLVAGTMIGSGIFMSPQFVQANIGSPGASLIIWSVCGLIALGAALSYAELGTIYKESGGDFIYILRIYGPFPAFLVAYTFMIVVRPSGISAIALSFAEYAVAPFYPGCTPPTLVVKCIAVACILVVAIANIMNVRFTMAVQVVFLVAKVVALIVIVIGGIVKMAQGSMESLSSTDIAFEGTNLGVSTIGMALYQGLWSYAGWYNLNFVTEEVKKPEVNLPRALMIAIPMVTVLYLLVNVSYLAVMTPRELAVSSAVAVTWGTFYIMIFTIFTIFYNHGPHFIHVSNTTLVQQFFSFLHFQPDILAMAHVRRLTPSPALIFTTVISLILELAVLNPLYLSASFTAWFFYGVTLSGLLYLKIKKRDLPRSYTVPIIIPFLVLLAAVFLVLAPIIDNPQIEYLYVTLFILSGVLIYVPFIHYKLCPGFLNKLTVFLQLFLEVAPADKNL